MQLDVLTHAIGGGPAYVNAPGVEIALGKAVLRAVSLGATAPAERAARPTPTSPAT
ncbi:hypothetical protein ACFZAV_38795 [Streptomyces sp. NPDC008343]|uniref:hypothetical protein n=1 Tax=Streptomyces sp. NPDC008343 TaxID=3364828 RepID=UPI0036EA7BCE